MFFEHKAGVNKTMKFFNITLLSLLILIASIADIYSHTISVNADPDATERVREIEALGASIVPNVVRFSPNLVVVESSALLVVSAQSSQLNSIVPQLLCSHRIALPPPWIS
jgi:hypothetical protein